MPTISEAKAEIELIRICPRCGSPDIRYDSVYKDTRITTKGNFDLYAYEAKCNECERNGRPSLIKSSQYT